MTKPVYPFFSPRLLFARDEAAGVRLFRFAAPPGFAFTPGQFLMLHFADSPKIWRAYSLCSAPGEAREFFEVAMGMVGAFSDRLGALQPGAEGGLMARGPSGTWIYDGSAPHAVLVSAGTSITPFRAMCRLKTDGDTTGRITLCYSAKTRDGLLFRNEYDGWKKSGIEMNVRAPAPWTAVEVFKAANDPAAAYYLCGPNKMVQEMRKGLQALGVPGDKVSAEKWGDYTDLI